MKIIGFDPGITKTGWSVIESIDKNIDSVVMSKSYDIKYSRKTTIVSHGVVKTKSNDFMQIRLAHIYQAVEEILQKHKPDLICVEITIVNINPKTSLKLAEARGVIIAACGKLNIPLIQIPPSVIKKTISGHGHCDKISLGKYIEKRVSNFPDKIGKDEIDALCCAYVGYSQRQAGLLEEKQ